MAIGPIVNGKLWEQANSELQNQGAQQQRKMPPLTQSLEHHQVQMLLLATELAVDKQLSMLLTKQVTRQDAMRNVTALWALHDSYSEYLKEAQRNCYD